MKLLKFGIAISLGVSVTPAQAEETITFQGQVYPLSILTENCKSMADDPQAMIACFNQLSDLMEEQTGKKLDTGIAGAEVQNAVAKKVESEDTAALDAQRLEAEQREAARKEEERLAEERLAALRAEADRLEAQQKEAKRLEEERKQAERLKAEQAEAERQKKLASVPKALEDLRALAQYQDADTGLSITGTGCAVRFVYFGNYYHLSRRNVSTLDLFTAEFDAAQLQYDKTIDVPGGQVPLLRATMAEGAQAATSGGIGMDSALHKFAPKSARSSLDAYAAEVAGQLPVTQAQTFDFVLVHPARSQSAAEIRGAFEAFATACSA